MKKTYYFSSNFCTIFVNFFKKQNTYNAKPISFFLQLLTVFFLFLGQKTQAQIMLTAPQDVTLSCSDAVPEAINPEANGGVAPYTFLLNETSTKDVNTSLCAHYQYVITRTWTVTDAADETATVSQNVTVQDLEAPVFQGVPTDITYNCSDNITLYEPTTSDCGIVTLFYNSSINYTCANSYIQTRTWIASDACGNSSTVIQLVTVKDETAPVFDIPQGDLPTDITINCGTDLPDITLTATDACSANLVYEKNNGAPVSGICPVKSTVLQTWSATDACENKAIWSRTVTTVDLTPPSLANIPENVTLTCEDAIPDAPSDITASDVCDVNASIFLTEQSTYDSDETKCAHYTYKITRTWQAKDICENEVFATQEISVIDETAPNFFNTPDDVTITCLEAVNYVSDSEPIIYDACSGFNLLPTLVEDIEEEQICPLVKIIRRTWSASDVCGNTADYTQNITVKDEVAPVFVTTPPADMTVECDDIPASISLEASDDCSGSVPFTVAAVETITPGDCPQKYTLTRTWTASDACDNKTTQTQIISVEDTTPPDFVFDANNTPTSGSVSCDAISAVPTISVSDLCDNFATILLNSSDNKADVGTCDYKITRTWIASDACGNTATIQQILDVTDNVAPEFVDVPENVTISCNEIPTDENPTATDACDNNAILTLEMFSTQGSDPSNCAFYSYTITKTWTATDDCENAATTSQVITVEDKTAPIFVNVPAEITASCDAIPTPENPVTNGTITDFSVSDNCATEISIYILNQVSNLTCTNTYDLTRTWVATDLCGNTASVTQVVHIQDITTPILAGVPDDITVECDAVPAKATPTASDNCDAAPSISYQQQKILGTCPQTYTLTRTWQSADICGNTTTKIQTIMVQDTQNPTFDVADIPTQQIQCGEIVTIVAPIATDNCDNAPTVTQKEVVVTTGLICPVIEKKIITWKVTDACGNTNTISQIIETIDNTLPLFASVPSDISLSCDQIIPAATDLAANDNCKGVISSSVNETIANGTCLQNKTITRTWTANDGCNISTVSQQIFIKDETKPIFTTVPNDVTLNCGASIPNNYFAFATDNCGSVQYKNDVLHQAGNCPGNYKFIFTWTATDQCGNSDTVSRTVTYKDEVSPVFYSVPNDLTLNCGTSIPNNYFAFATDNCSSVQYKSDVLHQAGNCVGNYKFIFTWTATDKCGNSSTISRTVTYKDDVKPVFVNKPADVTVACTAIPAPATPTATDACSAAQIVYLGETRENGSCVNKYKLRRVWKATDACGNNTTCEQVICIDDVTPPIITNVPANVTVVACGIAPTVSIATITVSDNCSGVSAINKQLATTVSGNVTTKTWTVTDACNNIATTKMTITTMPATATASAFGGQNTICQGTPLKLYATSTMTGTLTYYWKKTSGDNGASLTSNAPNPIVTQTATMENSGVYSVTVTSPNGCTATSAVTITVNGVKLPALQPAVCNLINSINITPTVKPNATFTWSGLGVNASNINANPTLSLTNVTANSVLTYSLTVTYPGGCLATASTSVPLKEGPAVTATNSGPICAGSGAALSATGNATTYQWTGPNMNLVGVNVTTGALNNPGQIVYTLTATKQGCVTTKQTTVTVNPKPVVTITTSATTICAGSSLVLGATGGGNYKWATGNGITGSNCSQANISIPITTTLIGSANQKIVNYTLTVTNSYGCSAVKTSASVTLKKTGCQNNSDRVANNEGKSENLDAKIPYTKYLVEGGELSYKIYPNPVGDVLNVACESVDNETITATLFDLSGRQIHNEKWNSDATYFTKTIDVSSFQNGLYLLSLKSVKGEKVIRVVVQH